MSDNKLKNLYIFHGGDDFGLRQKIQIWKEEFAKKFSRQGVVTLSSENLTEAEMGRKLEEVLTPSLFSSKKLVVARNFLPKKAGEEILTETLSKVLSSLPDDYFLVFWQDSLDRRLKFNKGLLSRANVVEFQLPHGRELNSWIARQAKNLGLNLDASAIEKLAVLSGRDLYEEKKAGGRVIETKEYFDLWQIYHELEKLAAFSQNPSTSDIERLVVPKISENVFALSDAVVSQDKTRALGVLENLMKNESTDEKTTSIKLLGLISEQIRAQLVVRSLADSSLDQNTIANFLGWSPGRVFITLKNSANADMNKLKSLLARLLSIDIQIKSQDTNPKLLLDLLIARD